MLGALLQIDTPSKTPLLFVAFSKIEKPSAHNKRGREKVGLLDVTPVKGLFHL